MIKEVIVVEGKDDIAKVKAAVDAKVVATSGFGYGKRLIKELRDLNKKCGIIIFTDPDYMGNKIRADLDKNIKGAKHAFLPRNKALKKDNVGVENASIEDIKIAISRARPVYEKSEEIYTNVDLIKYGLSAKSDSKEKRQKVAAILDIGFGNSKQFLNNLNKFKIKREELEKALKAVEDAKTL